MTGAAAFRQLSLALLLLGLAACGGGDPEALASVRSPAPDTPQLWLVQTIGEGGAVTASTFVCADAALRAAFLGTRAQADGKPCEDVTTPRAREYAWALRCRIAGRGFAVSHATVGDLDQDYRLEVTLTPDLEPSRGAIVRQSHRFRRIGACPAGWRVGDSAKPGRRPARHHSKA